MQQANEKVITIVDDASVVGFWASSRLDSLALSSGTAEIKRFGFKPAESHFGEITRFILGESGILIMCFSQSGLSKVGCELCDLGKNPGVISVCLRKASCEQCELCELCLGH